MNARAPLTQENVERVKLIAHKHGRAAGVRALHRLAEPGTLDFTLADWGTAYGDVSESAEQFAVMNPITESQGHPIVSLCREFVGPEVADLYLVELANMTPGQRETLAMLMHSDDAEQACNAIDPAIVEHLQELPESHHLALFILLYAMLPRPYTSQENAGLEEAYFAECAGRCVGLTVDYTSETFADRCAGVL